MLHALVLAAQAFPIGDGAKNFGTEQTVTLGLERAVVNGFGLGDFTVRPRTDFLRAGQADTNGIEIGNQAGTIIRAAAIQGCFLLPGFRQGRGRMFCIPPAENPNYSKTATC
jgi:hypothetical protein